MVCIYRIFRSSISRAVAGGVLVVAAEGAEVGTVCMDAMQRVGGAGPSDVEDEAHVFTRFRDKAVRFPINENRLVKDREPRCVTSGCSVALSAAPYAKRQAKGTVAHRSCRIQTRRSFGVGLEVRGLSC